MRNKLAEDETLCTPIIPQGLMEVKLFPKDLAIPVAVQGVNCLPLGPLGHFSSQGERLIFQSSCAVFTLYR